MVYNTLYAKLPKLQLVAALFPFCVATCTCARGCPKETWLKDGSAQTDGNWTDMAAEKLREKKKKRRQASAKASWVR